MTIGINSSYEDVLKAVKKDGMLLDYAKIEYRNDETIVQEAVKQNPKAITFAKYDFLKNERFMLNILRHNKKAFEFFPHEWKDKVEFVEVAVELPEMFDFVSTRIKYHPNILLRILRSNPLIFKHLPEKFQSNKKFVLKAFESSVPLTLTLRDLPKKLRGNEKLVLFALKNSLPADLNLIDLRLLKSPDFALKMIRDGFNVDALIVLWKEFNINTSFISDLSYLRYIAGDASAWGSLNKQDKQDNKEFVKKALKVNSLVYNKLSETLQQDPEIIALTLDEETALATIRSNSDKFFELIPELRLNPNFFIKALNAHPYLLHSIQGRAGIDEILLGNESLALAVLKSSPSNFEKLPESLKTKEEFIKKALRVAPDIYNEPSFPENLKKSKSVIFYMLQTQPSKFEAIPYELKLNKAFVQKAVQKIPGIEQYVLTSFSGWGNENVRIENLGEKFPSYNQRDDATFGEDPTPTPCKDTPSSEFEDDLEADLSFDTETDQEEHPPSETLEAHRLKQAVIKAQKLYASWYKQSNHISGSGYDRTKPGHSFFSFFKNHKLTWFRHGKFGQEQAEKLVTTVNEPELYEEHLVWEEISSFLCASKTRYHEHSFASFLLDELKNLDGPLKGIEYAEYSHRYNKDGVVSKLEDYNLLQSQISSFD